MEKQRICKICNRRFSNGKAMGGHMRSHLAKLPIPPKPHQQLNINSTESITPTIQSLSSSSSLNLHPTKKKPFYISLNQEEDALVPLSQDSTIFHDKESDDQTESQPMNLTRRRSKRRRKEAVRVAKPPFVAAEQEVSCLYETFPEEEVAMCLVMLSKDKWNKKEQDMELIEDEEDEDEDEEEEEDDILLVSRSRTRAKKQSKFKCETCKKVFRSYQALGGHRASHKKITIKTQIFDGDRAGCGYGNTVNYVIEHKTFQCPFCFKVFESGQALGGHKKVHFSNLSNATNNNIKIASSTKFRDNLVIDLNLPAPEEDEEEVVTHETVSDYY